MRVSQVLFRTDMKAWLTLLKSPYSHRKIFIGARLILPLFHMFLVTISIFSQTYASTDGTGDVHGRGWGIRVLQLRVFQGAGRGTCTSVCVGVSVCVYVCLCVYMISLPMFERYLRDCITLRKMCESLKGANNLVRSATLATPTL